jgi:hypothetical protein
MARIRLLFYILLLLLAAGCATKQAAQEKPDKELKTAFTQKTVALMIVPTADDAETLRQSLLHGKPIPPSAEIIPISQLDDISTVLSKSAAGLRECGVSRIIPPSETNIGNAYIVLQKGSASGNSCIPIEGETQSFFQKIDENVGGPFIGILAVGLTLFLIALPFIL